MSETSLPETLPLVHDDDGYTLEIYPSEKHVLLHRIIMYPNNRNGPDVIISFRDLSLEAKRAVIAQINRRYAGKVVRT